ncbi:MAG: hypothetical protein CBB71_04460 [Rhodopirellula sp. TMED11]|nr:MAG: hypothetical protein CBB71_04460 [Rhodopirellula sp. TMED11]
MGNKASSRPAELASRKKAGEGPQLISAGPSAVMQFASAPLQAANPELAQGASCVAQRILVQVLSS